ncbi:MAG: O-antigen ligase family protein [Acetobacterales bacterium]
MTGSPTARERGGMTGWGFAVAALLAPPLAFPSAKAMVPLLFLAVAWEAAARFRRGGAIPVPSARVLWPLAALLGWALASTLWSVDPARSIRVSLTIAATCGTGALGIALARALGGVERRRIGTALLVGIAVSAVLFAIEFMTNAGLHFALRGAIDRLLGRMPEPLYPIDYRFVLNNGATVVAVLGWPAAVAGWRCYGWPGAAAAIAVTAAVTLPSDSAIAGVATIAGVVVLFLAAPLPRIAAPLLSAGMIGALLLMPLAVELLPRPDRLAERLPVMSDSAYHRLFVWKFAADRVADRPLVGWGMDSARSVPGGEVELVTEKPLPDGRVIHTRGELLPLHPHNAALQLWLELGAVGALLAALFATRAVRVVAAAATSPFVRGAGLAQAAAAFLIAAAGYGLWQSWWLAALWLGAALYAALNAGERDG